jgi:hypothetical protein
MSMSDKDRKRGYASDSFHAALKSTIPTKNPDIYYENPFTKEWQHLFRICDNALQMRPSFLDNSDTSSVTLQCHITYIGEEDIMTVSVNGTYLKREKLCPRSLFIT